MNTTKNDVIKEVNSVYRRFRTALLLQIFLFPALLFAQDNALYNKLPVGKYPVGFRIITITDSSRIIKPLVNYFGEKETGDRYQKISIHLWYPAIPTSTSENLRFEDYCYSHLQRTTNETIPVKQKMDAIIATRNSIERFFGKTTDENWRQLIGTKMLAVPGAGFSKEKFPLLIGMLRPLSTTVTNEMMASHGYVVAMMPTNSGRVPQGYITDIIDMQHAIAFLSRMGIADADNVGAYGFSGSGFSQVLLAMHDPRVKALADIESALYGENIWTIFSSSNFYDVSKLRVPFLHIYGKELAKADVKFDEFYRKKYSHRYHLLLNQPGLHHWDVATEGRASSTILHTRGEMEAGARASFELSNIYLLHFFNATLKMLPASVKILDDRSAIRGYHDSLWTIKQYEALRAPPDKLQFTELLEREGMAKAIELARHYREVDPAAEFIHENALNQLARQLRDADKLKDGLTMMQLATEFYPDRAWLWLNLSDMQEANGDIKGAIASCEKIVDMLKDLDGADLSFNNRIKRSAVATLKRLKQPG